MEHLNEQSWEYRGRFGTLFKCDRCDFAAPIRVIVMRGATLSQLCQDISQQIGYHATNIWPDLSPYGFNGYDGLKMIFFNEDGEEIDLNKAIINEHGVALAWTTDSEKKT